MSTRVTKSQLQDDVERLRAAVDHLETINARLTDEIADLRAGKRYPLDLLVHYP